MSKKSPKKEDKKVVQEFKCMHCAFMSTSKGGLTRHINQQHDGVTTRVGDLDPESRLSPQEESFCQIYVGDKEFFGNGTQSYIEAYNVTVGKGDGCESYEYCKFRAHKLLSNRRILKRINEIYEAGGFNDAHVDKQHEFLITQKSDLRVSLGAIQEYNKLKKRTVERHEHIHAHQDLRNLTDDELQAEKEKSMKFFNKE